MQVAHQLTQVKVLVDQGHLAALDLGHIQDVVQQAQQVVRRSLDLVKALDAGLLGLVVLQRDLGHANDAVHGRADLVRHARQEIALGLGRLVVALEVKTVLDDACQLRQLGQVVGGKLGLVHTLEDNHVGKAAVVCHGNG